MPTMHGCSTISADPVRTRFILYQWSCLGSPRRLCLCLPWLVRLRIVRTRLVASAARRTTPCVTSRTRRAGGRLQRVALQHGGGRCVHSSRAAQIRAVRRRRWSRARRCSSRGRSGGWPQAVLPCDVIRTGRLLQPRVAQAQQAVRDRRLRMQALGLSTLHSTQHDVPNEAAPGGLIKYTQSTPV